MLSYKCNTKCSVKPSFEKIPGGYITRKVRNDGRDDTLIISPTHIEEWFNNDDQHHRIGGPASISSNGMKGWFVNGKPHRLDGPAFEMLSGCVDCKEYWVDGIQLFPNQNFTTNIPKSEEEKVALINSVKFIYCIGKEEYFIMNEYLKQDVEFCKKYSLLFDGGGL